MFSVLTYSKENEGIEMKTEKRRNFIRLKKRRKKREEKKMVREKKEKRKRQVELGEEMREGRGREEKHRQIDRQKGRKKERERKANRIEVVRRSLHLKNIFSIQTLVQK